MFYSQIVILVAFVVVAKASLREAMAQSSIHLAAGPTWLLKTFYSDSQCKTFKYAESIQFGVCLYADKYAYNSNSSYDYFNFEEYWSTGVCSGSNYTETKNLATTCSDANNGATPTEYVMESFASAALYMKYSTIEYSDYASCTKKTAAQIYSVRTSDATGACRINEVGQDSSIKTSCSGESNTLTGSSDTTCGTEISSTTFQSCDPIVGGNIGYLCPSDDNDDGAACFAGSETVYLENGSTRLISEVEVGDRILSADTKGFTSFSSVVAIAHPKNDIASTFLHIETASFDVKVTPEHLLFASTDCMEGMKLTKASDVTINSCLLTVNGSSRVEAISSSSQNGIYSVVTEKEMIVVNGIVASPFAVNHAIANRYYDIHRIIMVVFPAALSFKFFESLHFGVSAFVGSVF